MKQMLKTTATESASGTSTTSAYPRRKLIHEINNRLNTLHLGITLMAEWDDPELQRLGTILRSEIETLEILLKSITK
jgi:hypothetical protein